MIARDEEDIEKAMTRLRTAIASHVHAIETRDQLTGLPNLAGLNEDIVKRLEAQPSKPFWLAFVEVDRFKSINDQFSYENADALLKRIAAQLQTCLSFFTEPTTAYRAHGDEFYLLGTIPAEGTTPIAKALEAVRSNVAAIRVTVEGIGPMSCTVSTGWICTTDLRVITDRRLVSGVERALAEAKHKRDCIVRYKKSFERRTDTITLRADCPKCRAKFSMDLKREANKAKARLSCPNCASAVVRPPAPAPPLPAPTTTRV